MLHCCCYSFQCFFLFPRIYHDIHLVFSLFYLFVFQFFILSQSVNITCALWLLPITHYMYVDNNSMYICNKIYIKWKINKIDTQSRIFGGLSFDKKERMSVIVSCSVQYTLFFVFPLQRCVWQTIQILSPFNHIL